MKITNLCKLAFAVVACALPLAANAQNKPMASDGKMMKEGKMRIFSSSSIPITASPNPTAFAGMPRKKPLIRPPSSSARKARSLSRTSANNTATALVQMRC